MTHPSRLSESSSSSSSSDSSSSDSSSSDSCDTDSGQLLHIYSPTHLLTVFHVSLCPSLIWPLKKFKNIIWMCVLVLTMETLVFSQILQVHCYVFFVYSTIWCVVFTTTCLFIWNFCDFKKLFLHFWLQMQNNSLSRFFLLALPLQFCLDAIIYLLLFNVFSSPSFIYVRTVV